jgi:hypothetical protein
LVPERYCGYPRALRQLTAQVMAIVLGLLNALVTMVTGLLQVSAAVSGTAEEAPILLLQFS